MSNDYKGLWVPCAHCNTLRPQHELVKYAEDPTGLYPQICKDRVWCLEQTKRAQERVR